jgi:hypothetical protein
MNPVPKYSDVTTNYKRAVIAKHMADTVIRAVALAERIRYRPGCRDTFVEMCFVYIGIKLK